jgi:Ca2+-dependent lipid-binding protein
MQSRGTSDPYVTLRIKDVTFGKTTVKLRTLSPTWQESFSVPLPV